MIRRIPVGGDQARTVEQTSYRDSGARPTPLGGPDSPARRPLPPSFVRRLMSATGSFRREFQFAKRCLQLARWSGRTHHRGVARKEFRLPGDPTRTEAEDTTRNAAQLRALVEEPPVKAPVPTVRGDEATRL